MDSERCTVTGANEEAGDENDHGEPRCDSGERGNRFANPENAEKADDERMGRKPWPPRVDPECGR